MSLPRLSNQKSRLELERRLNERLMSRGRFVASGLRGGRFVGAFVDTRREHRAHERLEATSRLARVVVALRGAAPRKLLERQSAVLRKS